MTLTLETQIMGRMNRLAQWFQAAKDLSTSGTSDEFAREEYMGEMYNFTHWASHKHDDGQVVVFLDTPKARFAIEPIRDQKKFPGVMIVEVLPKDNWSKFEFWVNASSIADLGNQMRARKKDQVHADKIFLGQI